MYNTHRGMVPAPNSRLTELLDQLRQEFETQTRSTGEYEHQCMSLRSMPSPSFYLAPHILNGEPALTVQVSPVHLWLRLVGRESR
jgi:hypothetical protein